jgi:hypothetical protein
MTNVSLARLEVPCVDKIAPGNDEFEHPPPGKPKF